MHDCPGLIRDDSAEQSSEIVIWTGGKEELVCCAIFAGAVSKPNSPKLVGVHPVQGHSLPLVTPASQEKMTDYLRPQLPGCN